MSLSPFVPVAQSTAGPAALAPASHSNEEEAGNSTDEKAPQALCLTPLPPSSATASYRDTYAAANAQQCRMNARHKKWLQAAPSSSSLSRPAARKGFIVEGEVVQFLTGDAAGHPLEIRHPTEEPVGAVVPSVTWGSVVPNGLSEASALRPQLARGT
ncbi:hypothetical protein CGC21_17590 [Leishmania donovani]|uniref:Uncharacterized protein n=1 Tax=Leishmania donovani TaxID=5661 RepID=A0A504XRB3_LEIDO|nr:hypothetical protein CGC21_17590 [Leishmania donovani]